MITHKNNLFMNFNNNLRSFIIFNLSNIIEIIKIIIKRHTIYNNKNIT